MCFLYCLLDIQVIDLVFKGLHDADPLDPCVLVLQDRHKSHLVDIEQICILLLINYYFQLYHVIYIYIINYKLCFFITYSSRRYSTLASR